MASPSYLQGLGFPAGKSWEDGLYLNVPGAVVLLVLASMGVLFLINLGFIAIHFLLTRPWDGSVRNHTDWVRHAPFPVFYVALLMRSFSLWSANLIPAPMRVLEIATAFVQSQVLYTLVNLKVPDTLAKTGPCTAEQLAKAVGAPNARWLERVLRAAVALDLLNAKNPKKSVASGDKASETLYSLTGLTSCLRSNDPTMISALVKLNEYNYDTATHLTEALLKGKSPQEVRTGAGFWEEICAEPERASTFDAAMTGTFECLGGKTVISGYNWSQYSAVVDVAGGTGGFLRPLLRQYPKLNGVLVDQPGQIQRGKELWTESYPELLSRGTFIAGDAFKLGTVPPPPFTGKKDQVAYMMKDILHNWGDGPSLTLLKNIRAAIAKSDAENAPSRCKLLIVETSAGKSPLPQMFQPRAVGDICMLCNFGDGQEREVAEFNALFEAAGFKLKRAVATKSLLVVVEAVPV